MKHNPLQFILTLLIFTSCGESSSDSLNEAIQETESTHPSAKFCGTPEAPLKIMPLGDSITEGEIGHNTYRRDLWFNLTAQSCVIDFVGSKRGVKGSPTTLNNDFDQDHEGYWGRRIDEVLPILKEKIINAKPDIVLVHLGSNDVFQNQSLESTIAELKELLEIIKANNPTTTIYLAKLITHHKFDMQIQVLNNLIEQTFSNQDYRDRRVYVVDQSTNYNVEDNYDGTHPAPIGESKIADIWTNAILANQG